MPKPTIPTEEQFAQRLKDLFPPGQAWIWSKVGNKLLLGLSKEQVKFRQALNSFLLDINPQTTINLFVEWQQSVSLPDECNDNITSTDRDEILLRLRGRGAESVEEYEALFIGSQVEEFFISRVDEMEVDDELVEDTDWFNTWVLKVPEELAGLTFMIVDDSEIDEAIEDFSNGFVCIAQKEFPAHQNVFIETF